MEVRLEPSTSNIVVPAPLLHQDKESKAPPHAAAAPPVEMEIPHHINEVSKLLKLSDEDLVDKLFPEHPPIPGDE